MLNHIKNFAVQIVPSVAATVIGAYIVNHYINAKPAPQAPAAAVLSTAQPKSDTAKPNAEKVEAKANQDAEIAGVPASGVKAKGISEKALLEKNAAVEKAVVVEKPQDRPAEKAVDKPAETTASLPAETKPTEAKRPAPVRAAKSAPTPVQSVVAAAPADAAAAVEERRDANDLARAAIERLRPNAETPRAQPAPRAPEFARLPEEPRVVTMQPPAQSVRPLPPPIVVSAPSESADAPRFDDPSRPTPPAEIPTARPPLDLRAEASSEPPKQKTNVADEMLSAAKSMFHAVLPK